MHFHQKILPLVWVAFALAACSAAPQVTRTQSLSESADAPYDNILVIFLFSSFDSRRYLENEVVGKLSELGVQAVASTSLMDTRTPVTRQTFLAMVEAIDADAVLVTRLVTLETEGKMVDMNPEVTYNFRPTQYFNVWSVDVEEYVEPQAVDFKHSLVLGTQLYSVLSKDVVWAIEAKSTIDPDFGEIADYSIYVDEAEAITSHLSKDGLIGK